jgi:signal peptidase I
MGNSKFKQTLKKVWHFIWVEDSIWSWIVNILLAFVLIKFLVYPGLGLALGTPFPIVAVVPSSMEHNGQNIDTWWGANQAWYEAHNITKEQFLNFPMMNGFNKGDIIVLQGVDPADVKVGKVMVFKSSRLYPKPDPIIHRVVEIRQDGTGNNFYQTKGDNNRDSINNSCDPLTRTCIDEYGIMQGQVLGFAVLRVPLLGYIKIWFFDLVQLIGGGIRNVLS